MDARTAVAPLAAPFRAPARAGLGVVSLLLWLMALGALVGLGLSGGASAIFFVLAGIGMVAVRKGRRALA